MTRHFGLPSRRGDTGFRRARDDKPAATFFVTAAFGVIGAAIAALSFSEARIIFADLFHGRSLIGAVFSAGFGCWMYIWIARPRFAAHFKPQGDAFSDLLRFYAKATFALLALLFIGRYAAPVIGALFSGFILCTAGGAGAAAAFQTVLAFVPAYEPENGA
ncbi:MAG: hypothetical protein AAGJ87_09030 [Pseudomonadota bacterium]